jgi:PrtD family type I secretion system ABC transporter
MRNRARSDLEKALKSIRGSFWTIGVYSFFINILMLAAPIYMLAVYDIVMPSKGLDTLFVVTLVILVFFIGSAVLEYVRSRVMLHISKKLDASLNKRIFDAAFDLAAKYPGKAGPQPLRDFNTLKSFLTGPGAVAFFDAPWFPIYIAIMFAFDHVYGFYGLGATVIILLLTWFNERATKKGLERSNEMFQKSLNHFGNSVRNVEVVEAMGMRRPLFRRWMEKHHEFMQTHIESSSTAAAYSNASKSFRMMSSSLMYGVGAILAIGGHISPGMIIAGAVLLGRALAPISQLVATWKSFSAARIAYHKLNDLLLEFDEHHEKLSLPDPHGRIDLENVVLAPPLAEKPILKGVSLVIEPGDCVGIIGPSAAGKSTIAKAMVGVWHPNSGYVRIDGADIAQYNRDELGQHLGYLPQDIELFEGTIAENIARFRDEDPARIIEAAKLSGTHDLIVRLPHGYETPIGPGGIALSGGQKQRIGLARAVYGLPKILILDEPNSNLDDAGEYALMMAIRTLKQQGSTIVFITHRQNLLALADKIAVVKDGVIAMYGSRDQVLQALAPQQPPNPREVPRQSDEESSSDISSNQEEQPHE